MTDREEMNIEYVLSIGVNEIGDWILSMEDEQEMHYALSIIECAHLKLLDEAVEFESDCKKASELLSKIWYH
jgi:hypothetical protein